MPMKYLDSVCLAGLVLCIHMCSVWLQNCTDVHNATETYHANLINGIAWI